VSEADLTAATVSAIVPCLDEEEAIGGVVRDLFAGGADEVIVVDGGSRDASRERAGAAGAQVVLEAERGYGRAVQAGIAAASQDAGILLFVDGDGSDRLEHVPALLYPIRQGRADFVQGSRVRGSRERGAMNLSQLVAGHLTGVLLRLRYGTRFTDMSPFRAIRRDALERLGMQEATFGWNLEMLMRASAAGLRCAEIAVGQRRRRGGVSKVSGDLRTALRAALVIVATFLRLSRELRAEAAARPKPAQVTRDSG
jgi:glycosyltransferase involved in cell wall biosynthesis